MNHLSRRSLLAAPLLSACRPARERRPNILLAIADDQSYPHTSAYGDPIVRTPAFDRVARSGVLFHNSFTCAPSCTPSRSAVLSGRNIWEVGEAGVLYGTIPANLRLYTHQLEDAGYFAGFTGKSWGPGDWRAGGLTRHPAGTEFNSRRIASPIEGIDTRDYAANFQDFLGARKAGQPFCFWFGSTEPHRIYARGAGLRAGKDPSKVRVPACWPDTPEVRSDILDYYQEIEYFDSHLERMLNALEKTGELENTLVIVTSDNGMPFPRAKVNLYERGTHMPLAISWPSALPGGRNANEFVSHADLAPTILEAAGLGGSERSLLPLLRSGRPDSRRDHAVTALERHTMCRPGGATYPIRAIRTATHLYIRNFAPDRWPTGGEFISSNKTTHGDVDACPTKEFILAEQKRFPRQYDLCFGRRPAEELYDVSVDPDQVDNIASREPEIRQQLAQKLETYLRQTGDPRIDGRDPWQAYPYRQTTGYGSSFNTTLPDADRDKARGGKPHKPE
jgi:uncharacterized sulfatase